MVSGGCGSAAQVFQAKIRPDIQLECTAGKLMHYSRLNLDERDVYVRALIQIAGFFRCDAS